ncbi:MAG: hypothetical protein IJZ56_02140, partial [Oscillospiraceae bacterium]|nr:hypothetical protein [Oscillospiraceae bacterium]
CNIPGVTVEPKWCEYDYEGGSVTAPAAGATLTFEAGKIYWVELWLTAAQPIFSHDITCTVNGVEPENVSYYSETSVMISLGYATEGVTVLDTLNITGIGSTEIGSVMTTANLQAEGAVITSATWSVDGEYQEGVSVFEDGMNYVLDVYARPAEGYMFGKNMVITFEGEPSDILWYQSAISMNAGKEVRYGKEDLYSVGISELPEEISAGTAPALEISVQDGNATVKDAYWVAADKTTKVTAFEDGKAYYLAVELEADEGYIFTENTDIYSGWWDRYPNDRTEPGETCTAYFYYSLLTEAEKVDITISGAEVGLKGSDVEVTVSGVEAEVSEIEVYVLPEHERLSDGVFENGKAYIVNFTVTAEDYEFTYDTEVTVNGKEFYYFGVNGSNLYAEKYTSFLKKIDKVELTVAEPEIGAKPGEVKVPEKANYTVDYYWTDRTVWEELDGEDVFLDGHRYQVQIQVEAKEGYDFAEDVAITVNGVDHEDYYLDDYQFADVELNESWTFADPIDKIELPAFPESIAVGGTPADIDSAETDKYTLDPMWVDMETGDPVTTFEDEKIYLLQYGITAKEGYEITEDTVVLMGGEEYTGIWQHGYTDGYALKFYVLGIEIVDRVDITLTAPALGEKPSEITAAENDKYEILWPEWYENATGDIFDEADEIKEFTAGKYIFASFMLTAKEGYAFDETTKIFVNGMEVEPAAFWAMGYDASVALRYEPLTETTQGGASNAPTGDEFPVVAVIALMVLAVAGVAVLVIGKKKFAK